MMFDSWGRPSLRSVTSTPLWLPATSPSRSGLMSVMPRATVAWALPFRGPSHFEGGLEVAHPFVEADEHGTCRRRDDRCLVVVSGEAADGIEVIKGGHRDELGLVADRPPQQPRPSE